MKFQYYKDMFTKTLDFKGKASVAEYWTCVLYNLIFGFAITLVGLPFVFNMNLFLKLCDSLVSIYEIVVFLPMLSLTIRRLHDTGRSGWSIIWGAIPVVGTIILIVYLIAPSSSKVEVWSTKRDADDELSKFYVSQDDQEQDFVDTKTTADSKEEIISSQSVDNKETSDKETDNSKNVAEQSNEIAEEQTEAKQETTKRKYNKKNTDTKNMPQMPKTRSQRIAELQQQKESGLITEEEYQKQVLDILKH